MEQLEDDLDAFILRDHSLLFDHDIVPVRVVVDSPDVYTVTLDAHQALTSDAPDDNGGASACGLEALPSEVLVAICHHLPCPEGLLRVMRTCTALRSAACDAVLWCAVRLGVSSTRAWTAERLEALLRRYAGGTTSLSCFGLRCLDDESAHLLRHAPSVTALHVPQCGRLTSQGARNLTRACESMWQLRTLDLSDCHRITGDGVGAFIAAFAPHLMELTLAGLPHLTDGAIEHLCVACPQLRTLDVSGCDLLTNHAIACLAGCTALRSLNLAGLDLLTELSPLRALSRLESLNVADCDNLDDGAVALALLHPFQLQSLSIAGLDGLGSASGRALVSQRSLTRLSAAGCVGITSSEWTALELPHLTDLSIAGCAVDTSALVHLCSCSSALMSLNLRSCNQLTAAGLHAVASCLPALTDLNVTKLAAGALTDGALGALVSGCPRLQRLHVAASDRVGFTAMSAVARLSKLRDLSIAGCASVSDECLLALGSGACAALESCDFSGCVRCRDSGVRALTAGCPQLQSLSLMGLYGLSDVGVRHVARQCPSLTSLCLMGCSALTDEALAWLSRLPALRLLNLGGCRKIGPLGVKSLAQGCRLLQSLDISNCVQVDAEALQAVCNRCELLHSLNVQGVPPSVTNAVQWRGWQSQTRRDSLCPT